MHTVHNYIIKIKNMLIPTQLGVMKNDKKFNFIQHFMHMIRYFFQNSTNYIKKAGHKIIK